jgi:hypothetical protein
MHLESPAICQQQRPPGFTAASSGGPPDHHHDALIDKAVQRLETALRLGEASSLPESATMVVSPWGCLDPAASGAGGPYMPPPTGQQELSPQPAAAPEQNSSAMRRVVPGRGTTHLLPTPLPLPLLGSLRLLHECFGLGLAPGECLEEGHDLFQTWALASLGSREHSGLVRERVAAAIAGRADWLEEAAESVRRALGGGAAKDHLLRIANDMTLDGGTLEVQAAAACDDVRIAVFDVDAQRLSTLAPPADGAFPVPVPASAREEAALLHFQGAYWLLRLLDQGGEMDMTMTGTMAMGTTTMGAGGGADLLLDDASMATASQPARMSEV